MLLWKKGLLVSLITSAGVLLSACGASQTLRALTPEDFGMTCTSDNVCVDDAARIGEARKLNRHALGFVAANVGPIAQPPRVLFCSTRDCFAQFGDPTVAAHYIIGFDTIVVNDIGWYNFIVRHEMIHHWQAEQIGPARSSRMPRWYLEGMAYVLSKDPRDPLPSPEIEGWRDQFNAWIAKGNDWRVPPR